MTNLKMQRKSDRTKYDSAWLINSAEDWYRYIRAEHGFDSATKAAESVTTSDLSALAASTHESGTKDKNAGSSGIGNSQLETLISLNQ